MINTSQTEDEFRGPLLSIFPPYGETSFESQTGSGGITAMNCKSAIR